MKITIKTVLRYLPGLLLLAGVASCTSEVLAPEYGPTDEGSRSSMRIELGVSASDIGIRTRAAAGDDELSEAFASEEVQSLWVGVFDVQTGNLVGQAAGFNPDSRTATVDILYYDAHPTLRVYGVANYDGVDARRGTNELSDLESLLNGVRTLTDFYTIAVDAVSANAAAIRSSAPLMMGVFKSTGDNNGEKDFHTVEAVEGGSFSVAYGTAGTSITLNDASVGSMYDRIDYKKFDGTIRLRRLLSQVNVTVAGNNGVTVSNLRYRKVNMPNEVYLQERQTYTDANGMKSYGTWVSKSPNKADSLITTNGPGNVGAVPGYDSDAEFTDADGLSFTFHQYENKHWGVGTVSGLNGREAVRPMTDFAGGPVFVALCTDAEGATIYNNYASYFEISLDVKDDNAGKSGTVVYRIHEGRCNDVDGQEQNPNEWDFTCIRNTKYTYKVTVSGFDHIDVSVNHNHADNNSGVAKGELWTVVDAGTIKDGAPVSFKDTILDYVVYSANGGNDPKVFGSDENSVLFNLPALSGITWDGDLSGAFTLDGKDLEVDEQAVQEGPIALAEGITFPEGKYNPKDYRYELYILTAAVDYSDAGEKPWDGDGCGAYTYWHLTYLPEDTRDPLGDSVDFDLAFANDWDAAASKTNGAVVGHIKEISIPEINLDKKDGVEPVYTIVLDGEEVWTGTDLLSQDLYAYRTAGNPFSANSVHKVQLVVSDQKDNYSELKSEEKTFVVYPTSFEWNYRSYQAAYFESENGTQGSYYGTKNYQDLHQSEANGSNYFALQQVASNMTAEPTYLQTGGDRNIFHIDPLYDAVLTIYASDTGNNNNHQKNLKVVYRDSEKEVEQIASVGFVPSTNSTTPFTFYVKKGNGGVDISSFVTEATDLAKNGNIRIHAVKLDYHDAGLSHNWTFSTTEWTALRNCFGTGGLSAFGETTINGLRVVGGSGKTLKAGTDYIQLGNTGNTEKCNFSFYIHKKGTLSVNVATPDRELVLYLDDGRGDVFHFKGTGQHTYKIEDVDEPIKVYLYSSSNSINVASIKFDVEK